MEDKRIGHEITLVEANGKKIDFLRHTCKDLGLNVEILHKRVEDIKVSKYHFVTARAVAPLNKFFSFFNNENINNIFFIMAKGKTWNHELNEFKKKWKFSKFIVKNKIDIDESGGVQILLKNLKRI